MKETQDSGFIIFILFYFI